MHQQGLSTSVDGSLAPRPSYLSEVNALSYRWCLALLLVITVAACRKEPPPEAPTVRFVVPSEGATLTVPETTTVVLQVDGERTVQRVSVVPVNAAGVAVAPGVEAFPGMRSGQVELHLPLLNETLASGPYRLLATVSDGERSSITYLPVQIAAAPLRRRAIFILSGTSNTTLQRIDSVGQLTTLATWPMDLCCAAVDPGQGSLFVAGGVSGPLTAYATDGQTVKWQQPGLGTLGLPYFTSLDLAQDGRLYVGRSDGYLRGLEPSNGGGMMTGPLNGIRSEHTDVMDELVISSTRSVSTPERSLVLHNRSSGTVAATQTLGTSVVFLSPQDAQTILLFGNSNGQGRLEARNVHNAASWTPRTWPSPITAAVRVDTNTLLVALADGSLERFTWNNAAALPISSNGPFVDLAYDASSGTVVAATTNSVQLLDPTSGQPVAQWSAGPDIRRILPLLNR